MTGRILERILYGAVALEVILRGEKRSIVGHRGMLAYAEVDLGTEVIAAEHVRIGA